MRPDVVLGAQLRCFRFFCVQWVGGRPILLVPKACRKTPVGSMSKSVKNAAMPRTMARPLRGLREMLNTAASEKRLAKALRVAD